VPIRDRAFGCQHTCERYIQPAHGAYDQASGDAKLLLLSAHDEPTFVAAAIAAGADGLVIKRAIGRDLMPAIDALLTGQRYFDSSATP